MVHTKRANKRYGFLLIITLINWLMIVLAVWKVDPQTMKNFLVPGFYLPMILLVFGGLFWFLSIIFMSSKHALIWSFGFCIFLELRFQGLGTFINAILILGLLGSFEFYELSIKRAGVKEQGIL